MMAKSAQFLPRMSRLAIRHAQGFMLSLLIGTPVVATTDDCQRLKLGAQVCLEEGQTFRFPPSFSKDGTTQLVEIALAPPIPNDVLVTYLATDGNTGLRVSDWSEALMERLRSRSGIKVVGTAPFRHRGSPGEIVRLIDRSEPKKPIWGAYAGIEFEDGVVMVLVSRGQEATQDDIAIWVEAALRVLYPEGSY